MRLVVLCISALLLVAAACSDDTKAPTPDHKLVPLEGGVKPDATTKSDGVTTSDGKPAGSDGPGTNLPCGAATDYAQNCSKACPTGAQQIACMVKCNDDGLKSTCASGKPLMEALVTCLTTICTSDCMAGPTPACVSCTKTKCKTDYDACYAHKC